jgi:pimeloyl-ACP methyl ester carboxylesterase
MLLWIPLGAAAAALTIYLTIVVIAAYKLTRTTRRLPASDPAEQQLCYEDVMIEARGERLGIAAWYIPAAESTQAVIVAHGIGGARGREFTIGSLDLVRQLVEAGFAVLMLDLRGHGLSDAAPMTYGARERRDVLGAVDWLLARGYAPGAIGVLGLSMGGVAGIGAASEEPAIGALVIDSSCADFRAMMSRHFRRASGLPMFFFPGVLRAARLLTGENLAALRPAATLRASPPRPVLVIHARGDRVVPVEHARALAEAAGGELWVTPCAAHLGSYAAEPIAYASRVISFFTQALIAAPPPFDGLRGASRIALDHTGRLASAAPASREKLTMRWRRSSNGLSAAWGRGPSTAPDAQVGEQIGEQVC